MGAWGPGAFENDDAMDWWAEVAASTNDSVLASAFNDVLRAETDAHVDATDAAAASEGTRTLLVPGDGLLHPVSAAALALLLVNDHLLKSAFPGLVTGKLSDFAGLVFFPMLVVAIWEVLASVARRWGGPRWLPLIVAVTATALAFTAIKVSPTGSSVFAEVLGRVQWLGATLVASVLGSPMPRTSPVVRDPTDLVALFALLVALVIGIRRINQQVISTDRSPS